MVVMLYVYGEEGRHVTQAVVPMSVEIARYYLHLIGVATELRAQVSGLKDVGLELTVTDSTPLYIDDDDYYPSDVVEDFEDMSGTGNLIDLDISQFAQPDPERQGGVTYSQLHISPIGVWWEFTYQAWTKEYGYDEEYSGNETASIGRAKLEAIVNGTAEVHVTSQVVTN